MGNARIYGVLIALVIWIFGGTYWIVAHLCPNQHHFRNNPLSVTYNPNRAQDTLIVFKGQPVYWSVEAN